MPSDGWTSKEMNRVLNIEKVTDVIKRPPFIEDEIVVRPQPLSRVPNKYKIWEQCPNCFHHGLIFDRRRKQQVAKCDNCFQSYMVRQTGMGQFKWKMIGNSPKHLYASRKSTQELLYELYKEKKRERTASLGK